MMIVEQQNVVIQSERWNQIWPACEPLMRAQSEEVYGRRPKAFSVDYEGVCRIELAGVMLILSARLNKRLIGYIIWFVSPDLESSGRKIATAGPWYVLPEFRVGGVGRDLMLKSEIELMKRGVSEIHAHSPIKNGEPTPLSQWFVMNGWKSRQLQFVKEL